MGNAVILGIDPGQSGGIARIGLGGVATAIKMPETERDIWEAFATRERPDFAVIEAVSAMPKQGVSSTFKFGRSYGFLRACLIASEIPFAEVRPAVWQRELGCLSRGDKNVTKARAQQLFPKLKVTHALADALLIAEYARRLYWATNTETPPRVGGEENA